MNTFFKLHLNIKNRENKTEKYIFQHLVKLQSLVEYLQFSM